MLVDLHIHTSNSSPCSDLSVDEALEAAVELGLDAVAVTEHATHHGALLAHEAGRKKGFTVFRGVEVCTTGGDMIVFGAQGDFEPDMEFQELLRMVRSEGGLVIAAHPTHGYWGYHHRHKGYPPREVLEQVDAVEVLNGGCSYEENVLATRMASELGLPQVGGSDAHTAPWVGRCVTVFSREVSDETELVEAILEGNCRAAYLEDVVPILKGKTAWT